MGTYWAGLNGIGYSLRDHGVLRHQPVVQDPVGAGPSSSTQQENQPRWDSHLFTPSTYAGATRWPVGMGSCIQQVTRPGVPAMRMTRLKNAEADSVPQEKQWRPPGFSALGGSTSKSGAGVCVLPVRPLSYTLDVTWPPSGIVPVLPLKSTLARRRATLCARWATTLPLGTPSSPGTAGSSPATTTPNGRRPPNTRVLRSRARHATLFPYRQRSA